MCRSFAQEASDLKDKRQRQKFLFEKDSVGQANGGRRLISPTDVMAVIEGPAWGNQKMRREDG